MISVLCRAALVSAALGEKKMRKYGWLTVAVAHQPKSPLLRRLSKKVARAVALLRYRFIMRRIEKKRNESH